MDCVLQVDHLNFCKERGPCSSNKSWGFRLFTYQGHNYCVTVPDCVEFNEINTLSMSRDCFEKELGITVISEEEANEIIYPWTGKKTYGRLADLNTLINRKTLGVPEPCYVTRRGQYRLYVAEEIREYVKNFAENFPARDCDSCSTSTALPGLYIINEFNMSYYLDLITDWAVGNYENHRFFESRRFFVCYGCRNRIIREEEKKLDKKIGKSDYDRANDGFIRLRCEAEIVIETEKKGELLCQELSNREKAALDLGKKQVKALRKYLRSDPEVQRSLEKGLEQLRISRI